MGNPDKTTLQGIIKKEGKAECHTGSYFMISNDMSKLDFVYVYNLQSVQPSGTADGDAPTATDGLPDASPGDQGSDQPPEIMPTTSDGVDSTVMSENETRLMGQLI